MSDPFWFLDPPQVWLTSGMFVTSLAAGFTYIGKVSDHSFGWIERVKDPKGYWLALAAYYLLGLGLIGVYLYKVYGVSN
jgi:hypothetical protein